MRWPSTAMINTDVPPSTRYRLMHPASAERRLTRMVAPRHFVRTPVVSTTWKSSDGPRIHWKYVVDNVIVYRGCDARFGVQQSAACRVTWFSSRQPSSLPHACPPPPSVAAEHVLCLTTSTRRRSRLRTRFHKYDNV